MKEPGSQESGSFEKQINIIPEGSTYSVLPLRL